MNCYCWIGVHPLSKSPLFSITLQFIFSKPWPFLGDSSNRNFSVKNKWAEIPSNPLQWVVLISVSLSLNNHLLVSLRPKKTKNSFQVQLLYSGKCHAVFLSHLIILPRVPKKGETTSVPTGNLKTWNRVPSIHPKTHTSWFINGPVKAGPKVIYRQELGFCIFKKWSVSWQTLPTQNCCDISLYWLSGWLIGGPYSSWTYSPYNWGSTIPYLHNQTSQDFGHCSSKIPLQKTLGPMFIGEPSKAWNSNGCWVYLWWMEKL